MDEVGLSLLLLCIFTPLLLFFTLNGLALRSFSRMKLQEAFRDAGREHMVHDFLNHLEELILTCGLFRIVLNTGTIFILINLLKQRHFILTFVVTVLLLELCGLLIPHAWAKHAGEFMLPRTYPWLRVVLVVIRPLLVIFHLHDRLVKRLAGVVETDAEQAQEERQEEILSFVEQGRIEGIVDEEEVEMIENVLELGETTAEEIMTPRTDMVAIEARNGLGTILETIRDKGHSRIPVYDDTIDHITGLIYAKDLLTEIGRDPKTFNLKEKMREAYFVPESKLLRDLLHEFQSQKLHIAVVLDEYGGTAGIVTIEDILEELVGEITDEYEKAPVKPYKKLDELTYDVDARMYIDDVNEELDIELPEEEDYDTIGGFVFSHLGYIPKVGEHFEHSGVTISITAAGPRVVKKLRLKKKPKQPQQ